MDPGPCFVYVTSKIDALNFEVGSGKSEVGSRNSEVGTQSEVGSRKSEVGTQKSEVGNRKSEDGSRKSEVGSRKSEVGSRKSEVGSPLLGFRTLRWSIQIIHPVDETKLYSKTPRYLQQCKLAVYQTCA